MAGKSKPHPDKVRLPLTDEIERVALVATAGFYYSPANAYERPRRDKYPRDTFQSYHREVLTCLWNPERILIVVDGTYEKSEDEKLYPALKEEYGGREWRQKDGRLIVGFACLTLKSGSPRKGQFQPEGDRPDIPDECELPKRDESKEGIEKLEETIRPSIKKHFGDEFSVDMIAVHPMYWRRLHGTSLLLWAAQLGDADQEKEIIEVEGHKEHSESFTVWIGVREPQVGWGFTKQAPQGPNTVLKTFGNGSSTSCALNIRYEEQTTSELQLQESIDYEHIPKRCRVESIETRMNRAKG